MRRVTIIGGGYSGAAAVVQLANAAGGALEITVVEPREALGRGLAYSTPDPDHRLNGPLDTHLLDPTQLDHVRQWCMAHGLFERDPEARAANGGIYIRRGDFGTYVGETAAGHCLHRRTRARALSPAAYGYEVHLDHGAPIAADAVVIATGNALAPLPAFLAPLRNHPALVVEPLEAARLQAIPADARVLLVGGGLTALDVLSTLLQRGHRGMLTAVSRHGVRPRPHRAQVPENSVAQVLARVEGAMPPYVEPALRRGGILGLTRELRSRIAAAHAAGEDWQVPFDELRDVVWRFWPRLPLGDKQRFLRHLRVWYDAHRFRAPPQNEAMVRAAEREGRVRFVTGRVRAARATGDAVEVDWGDGAETFDVVVNTTGLDAACGARTNPLLASLLDQGVIRADPTGIGFEVDAFCRPLASDGSVSPRLRIIGPPTAGSLGDPLGVIFIAPQIARMVPGLLAEIGIMRR